MNVWFDSSLLLIISCKDLIVVCSIFKISLFVLIKIYNFIAVVLSSLLNILISAFLHELKILLIICSIVSFEISIFGHVDCSNFVMNEIYDWSVVFSPLWQSKNS